MIRVEQFDMAEVDNGNSGSAKTIDWNAGQNQKVTLNAATPTFTFTAPGVGMKLLLVMIQDTSGSRDPIWPAAVEWPADTEPTWSTAPNAVDLVSFYWNGISYRGMAALGYAA